MKTNKDYSEHKFVAGIGASEALTALSSNTGFLYIIVQHRSPDYKSLLS